MGEVAVLCGKEKEEKKKIDWSKDLRGTEHRASEYHVIIVPAEDAYE